MRSRSLSVSLPTYFVWRVSQASRMRPKSAVVDADESGAGVVDPVPPKAGRSRRPTPIPTLNATTSKRPMAARRSHDPRPRPAAGDSEAREGPGTTGAVTGGSGSVVGSVGIGSESIVVMLLESVVRSDGPHCADRPRALCSVGQAWRIRVGMRYREGEGSFAWSVAARGLARFPCRSPWATPGGVRRRAGGHFTLSKE